MFEWDIDRFPLEKTAISEVGFPETDAEWRTWQEAQNALGKPMGSDAEGHSEYDPEVWMMGKHAPSHEKYAPQDNYDDNGTGEYSDDLYPSSHYDDDDEDEDREPDEYHVVTGPRGSTDRSEWTEHPYHAFGSAYTGTADSAHDMFMEDNPEFDTERHPENTHEVINVHPAEHHDAWHNQLRSEDEAFSRIAPHGFERENPEMPGHMAYKHVDPHGGVHRLWHNETNFINTDDNTHHGPGWRTSYWHEGHPSGRQFPWTFHDDNIWGGDSLGDALDRVQRNQAHSAVMHSDTDFKPVENSYGRHYVSRRPNGSVQQLLYNQGRGQDSNWMLVHYHPENSSDHAVTFHGADLPGALEQARRNLARG